MRGVCLALFAAAFTLATHPFAHAAEWQWSVQITSVVSDETHDHPRAFLWIPPNCQRVRGVVVGQHNMQEEPILEHPLFRETVSNLGFAEVWVSPGWNLKFRFDQGAGEQFDQMMNALAEASGYGELRYAPIVPIGHSYTAIYPWNFAAWNPGRTLAVLSVSGQFPYGNHPSQYPTWWPATERNVDGVPGLVTMGGYEDIDEDLPTGAQQRHDHPGIPLSMVGCAADAHFAPTDEKVGLLALYLRKAAKYRLLGTAPADGPVKLKTIDPTTFGWLVDHYRKDQPPRWPSAPVGKYQGDPKEAFWFFDEEMAKAAQDFGAEQRGKKVALLGYMQDGKVVEQSPTTSKQVLLKFLPIEDGLTFKLTPTFIDRVPASRPTQWTGLPEGATVSHSASNELISIKRICGPVEQLGPDTWAIRYYRMGMNNAKRSNDIWLVAMHPGDQHYKRAVQHAFLQFPNRNNNGDDQTISFPPIGNQRNDAMTLKLGAMTSAPGSIVHYYVREGPVEIVDGNTLKFTPVPPRAKYPIRVTVVAWQWGRSIAPLLKTAEPVERSFDIVK